MGIIFTLDKVTRNYKIKLFIMLKLEMLNENLTNVPDVIAELDFERIKYKLTLKKSEEGKGWSQEKVEASESEYRRYLTLILNNPSVSIVPSKLMDDFWHMHILDTKAYREDCLKVFGKFIDHYPYFGIYGNDDKRDLLISFEATKRLYYDTFKEQMKLEDASRCEGHACHAPSACACRVPGTCK